MKNDYKYDNFGNLDTDYYVEKAYEMRRAYFSTITKKTVTGIKHFFAGLFSARHNGQAAH